MSRHASRQPGELDVIFAEGRKRGCACGQPAVVRVTASIAMLKDDGRPGKTRASGLMMCADCGAAAFRDMQARITGASR